MGKFRKKPIVIEAMQLRPDTLAQCIEFVGEDLDDGTCESECYIYIRTLEGTMGARCGDWIIQGVSGEFYPCKPDIFVQTYDPVEDG